MTSEFTTAMLAFLAASQGKINGHFESNYQNLTPPILVQEPGRKYVKVVRQETDPRTGRVFSRSVYCFVRIADGAVLKAAGFKAPAKHARGNIYVNAGQDAVTLWGANYLRG